MSYQEKKVGNQAYLIFALAVVLVYLVLSAQYESWCTPTGVILVVPLALLGTMGGIAGGQGRVATHPPPVHRPPLDVEPVPGCQPSRAGSFAAAATWMLSWPTAAIFGSSPFPKDLLWQLELAHFAVKRLAADAEHLGGHGPI